MSWLTLEAILLLARGLTVTAVLTAVTSALALILGVGVGTMRLSARPFLRGAAGVYVDSFRNIPALVLIIFFAFAIPNLFPTPLRQTLFFNNVLADWGQTITGLSLPYYALAAAAALTLNAAAYLAEIFRAGVSAIPQEFVDAARLLGADNRAIFRHILLPEGLRVGFPAIATRLIHNMKNTALASFVAVPEFFQATQSIITRTFRATELLLLAAIVYLLLSAAWAALLRRMERRLDRRATTTANLLLTQSSAVYE